MDRKPVSGSDEYEIKPSDPHDSVRASKLIYSSGPDVFDYLFTTKKHHATEFIDHAFRNSTGYFGAAHHTSVYKSNRLIAVGSYYTGRQIPRLALDTMFSVFRFFGPFSSPLIILKSMVVFSKVKSPDRDSQYLSNFGVDPEFQGKKAGSKLYLYMKDKAEKAGIRYLIGDVSVKNPDAKRLYLNVWGFKVQYRYSFLTKEIFPLERIQKQIRP